MSNMFSFITQYSFYSHYERNQNFFFVLGLKSNNVINARQGQDDIKTLANLTKGNKDVSLRDVGIYFCAFPRSS